MKVTIPENLLAKIHSGSNEERHKIGEAIREVQAGWGHPHVHSGIDIRRLSKTIDECRVGLDDRLTFLFIATPPELVFFFIANHDEIQKLLRLNK